MSNATTFHMRDIWEWYSIRLLRSNPTWVGVTKNRIQNFYIYAKYKDENGKKHIKEVMSYSIFMECMSTFFETAKDYVVQGEYLVLGSALGYIAPRRVERDHRKKSVNFVRTNAQPKVWSEEKQKMVASRVIYHTEDDWCKIAWSKFYKFSSNSTARQLLVKNLPCYQFKPAKDLRSGRGFDQLLTKALRDNPLLKYKFTLAPLNKKKA